MEQDFAKELIRRFESLSGDRGTWESHWQEVAERVLPSYSGAFNSVQTPGAKRTEQQYDSTAANALPRFSAAMESMLTPRNMKWHRLRASIPELNKDRDVRIYFDEVSDILFRFRYAPKANFASQNHENYTMLGAFGTGCMFIDELNAKGTRYKAIHLGEMFFLENHQGLVDTAFRRFKYTARQAAQKWGLDKMPSKIKAALDGNKPEVEFDFLHIVMPREDRVFGRLDAKGMEFASYYVALSDKVMMSEGGYHTFPYAISRYVTAPGETYGRSPAMQVLPAIKVLNEQKKTVLKQGHRVVDPVLLAYDDGVLDTFSLRAGAVNYGAMTSDGKRLVDVLPTGNIAIGKDLMDDERVVINDAFLVTLFQILVETPQMTATEVLERAREKGALLSPTMGRQQSEYLGPLIDRELDILSRQGLLPPLPGLLQEAGGEYEVQYDSPLSRAQRAEEAAGLFRLVEFATNHATVTQDPSAFDWIDVDTAMPELADLNAVPARWVRSGQAVEQIREGRQQQASTQQMIEAGPSMAAVLKAQQGAG